MSGRREVNVERPEHSWILFYRGVGIMIDQPRVWVIRADYGASTDAFAENGYIGVGHRMDGVDLSRVTSQDEIKRLFVQEHPDEQSAQSIGNRSSQVARFHLEIRSEDYVLTPELDREWVRYGRFDSDNRYYVDKDDGLPHRNRRNVNWSSERLRRDDLPDGLLQGGMTLYEVADESRRDGFFRQDSNLAATRSVDSARRCERSRGLRVLGARVRRDWFRLGR